MNFTEFAGEPLWRQCSDKIRDPVRDLGRSRVREAIWILIWNTVGVPLVTLVGIPARAGLWDRARLEELTYEFS